jgi:hypothetical protein
MNDISKEIISYITSSSQFSQSISNIKYNTYVDVHVEIIDKSIPLSYSSIYLIGNTMSKLVYDPAKVLTTNSKTLLLTNPVVSYDNYFKVTGNKMIRILNLESLFP